MILAFLASLALWLNPVLGSTGPHLLSAMITETSVAPPRQASNFPSQWASSQVAPNLASVWEFSAGQFVRFAFHEQPPNDNHIMEVALGTFMSGFVCTITDSSNNDLLNWRSSDMDYYGPFYWFTYVKMDLSGAATSSFTIRVSGTRAGIPAFMVLSDIISVWELGVKDANYGIGFYRIPTGSCYEPTRPNYDFKCVTTVRDWDMESDELGTPNFIAGGVVGTDDDGYYANIDFSFLGELDSIKEFDAPIIQADVWSQEYEIYFYPAWYEASDDLTLDDMNTDGEFYNYYDDYYIFGMTAALVMYGPLYDWRIGVQLEYCVISNFLRVFDPVYSALLSVQVENLPTDAKLDDTTQLFNNFYVNSDNDFPPCGNNELYIEFQTEPSNWNQAFWTACPEDSNIATFEFEIPPEVAGWNCPWLNFVATDNYAYDDSMAWHMKDSAGKTFMARYLRYRYDYADSIIEETVSLRNVSTGTATLTVESLYFGGRGVSFYPWFRFFETQGACGAPVCETVLPQYTPSGLCSLSQLTDQQREYLARNVNANLNCSEGVQQIGYIQASTAPTWVPANSFQAQVVDWGGADFGVFTAYPTGNDAATQLLGIAPEVDPRIAGSQVFLWQIETTYADGTMANTSVQVQLFTDIPVVYVLVFDGSGTGTELTVAGGEYVAMDAPNQFLLTVPAGSCAVAGYTTPPGTSPGDDGSDEALLGLLALIAVPFLCSLLLGLCAWLWMRRRPKQEPIPMQPMYYQPLETFYWTQAPAVSPVAYTAVESWAAPAVSLVEPWAGVAAAPAYF